MADAFHYDEAFSRNIGWITEWEQLALRRKKVAVAGMGGVGGVHLLTLARLGVGAFHISDLDNFELVNFNRQIGAMVSTLGQPKVEVLADMARDINPEIEVTCFGEGVNESNIDAFLDGVDLFVDGFDFFVLDIRAKVFQRCHERGIPAITAAPIGFGTGWLIFMPNAMSFEQYFRLNGLSQQQQYVNFFLGVVPAALQRTYLVDPTRLDLAGERGPSSAAGCQLAAGVVAGEAIKILLDRGGVKAAPWYHHFDAHRGKLASRRLWRGNRNPLQRLKLKAAYKGFAALSRQSWQPPAREDGPEIEQILDLARWTPSGDNVQPWRFEVESDDKLAIRVRPVGDIYDYNDGQPTLLAAGMLLESLRIAASKHGSMVFWNYRGAEDGEHVIDVSLSKAPGVTADPLLPYIAMRSVDRKPYQAMPLTPDQRQRLAASLGDELEIAWHEMRRARWREARINGAATDIRLQIPEAFAVHRRMIDWANAQSPTGIPAGAIGVDAMTLKAMRWGLQDWERMQKLNRLGTFGARLQMDYLPGLKCAAHFTVRRKAAPAEAERIPALLRAGERMQRFWLTATQMGLSLQPAFAPVIFAHYGAHNVDFTADPNMRAKAAALAKQLNQVDSIIFRGRVGRPASRRIGPRSVRRPLEELMRRAAAEPAAADDTPQAMLGPRPA